jgi:Lipocalin-like domain
MQPGRQSSHSALWSDWSTEEFETFGRGYIGYCGRYEVDEEHGTVTHLPSVAFLPNLIGQRLLRQVSITGNRLILKTAYTLADGSNVTSLLEWSRTRSSLQQS